MVLQPAAMLAVWLRPETPRLDSKPHPTDPTHPHLPQSRAYLAPRYPEPRPAFADLFQKTPSPRHHRSAVSPHTAFAHRAKKSHSSHCRPHNLQRGLSSHPEAVPVPRSIRSTQPRTGFHHCSPPRQELFRLQAPPVPSPNFLHHRKSPPFRSHHLPPPIPASDLRSS